MNLFRSRSLGVVALSGVSIVSFACQKDSSTTSVTAAVTSASSVPQHATLADDDIAKAVRRYMQEDSKLRSQKVLISVQQGVANLSGSVDNLLAAEHALHLTETIKGVRSVVDQIVVSPLARTDDQLKQDVLSALRRDNATRPYTLGVTAKDGKITLSGTADSCQQKILFADVAKTVRGIKSVENAVVVHYTLDRPKSEITTDIQHRLANDMWLDGDVVSVAVKGHTVRLGGVVDSVAQKSRALSDAWVMGVNDVDNAAITVDWAARVDQRRVNDYALRTDPEIVAAVRDAFRFDPRLKTMQPQVAAQYGAVTLSGIVDTPQARTAAESDAKDTLGVWNIRDEVLVQPGGNPTDSDIERAAKQALSDDPFLSSGKSIQVSSTKGKVALKGTLPSPSERFDIVADIVALPGVVEIDDGTTISRPIADIKASIEDRLFWDPIVEREQVTVTVAPDGIATLSGMVDSWGEIKAASDDALKGGASRIINVLKLKKHPEFSVRAK